MDEKGNFEWAALFKNLEGEETENRETLLVNINILSAASLIHKSGLTYTLSVTYMSLIQASLILCRNQNIMKVQHIK